MVFEGVPRFLCTSLKIAKFQGIPGFFAQKASLDRGLLDLIGLNKSSDFYCETGPSCPKGQEFGALDGNKGIGAPHASSGLPKSRTASVALTQINPIR